jgi:ectoine hydroxylase-related dioxygenase (phytanoyl-CoA dioxygenase family)
LSSSKQPPSQAEIDAFNQQGYVVFNELFSQAQMETLKQAALTIVDDFDPASTRSIFSTKSADTARDDYFLTSDDKVRCFFEEEAFDDNGDLKQEKALSINKIGHALHNLTPEFKTFSELDIIKDIAKGVGLQAPEIRQSMYIFKQPKIGGEIRWHQDATYFYTTPMSVVTFWLAIEDAHLLNGCLQIDKTGGNYPLKEQFKRYPDDTTELVSLQDIPWPKDESASPLEVKAGSLVVFNGVLPHFSEANRSTKSRHAFTLHITCANTSYDKHNWLQAAPKPLI